MPRGRGMALLGASGLTGGLVAEALAARGETLLLAARRLGPLQRLARRLHGEHGVAVVDATDPVALRELADRVDVLVDCAGPYGALGPASARAAVAAGTHLVDVSGELHHAQACAELDSPAAAAGVALVNGAGVEVALSDCGAAVAAAGLTQVDRIVVIGAARHFMPGRGSRISALRMCAEPLWAWQDGGRVPRRVAEQLAHLPLAPPYAHSLGLWIPGLENLTLPRHLPVQTVQTWAAVPALLAAPGRLLSRTLPPLARSGLLEPLARAWPDPDAALAHARFRVLVLVSPDPGAPPTRRVQVDGRDVYRSTAAIVAWIATRLRDRGPACGRGGTLAPAQAVDPYALMAALPQLGMTVQATPAPSALEHPC